MDKPLRVRGRPRPKGLLAGTVQVGTVKGARVDGRVVVCSVINFSVYQVKIDAKRGGNGGEVIACNRESIAVVRPLYAVVAGIHKIDHGVVGVKLNARDARKHIGIVEDDFRGKVFKIGFANQPALDGGLVAVSPVDVAGIVVDGDAGRVRA